MNPLMDRAAVEPDAEERFADPATHLRISRFLFREASLLDGGEVRRWLEEILAPDVRYDVPVRVTRERDEARDRSAHDFSDTAFHLRETRVTLETRVARLEGQYAWAEDPPSRTRRFVTNIVAELVPAPPSSGTRWAVTSNLLLFRGRYDSPEHALVSCVREDQIGQADGGTLRVHHRRVLLDHTTLPLPNLAVFL